MTKSTIFLVLSIILISCVMNIGDVNQRKVELNFKNDIMMKSKVEVVR